MSVERSTPIPIPEPIEAGELLRCPECNRPAVTSLQYKTHYRAAHASAGPRERPCERCGETFHDNYHPEQRYCSPECAQEARRDA